MAHSPRRFDKTVAYTADMEYLLYLPQGYDGILDWPLVLFLHGAGERGNDLDLLKTQGLPKRLHQGQDVPFIVLSPQCPQDDDWAHHHQTVIALLDEIIATHPVDTSRVYLTGLSMGGYGTWNMARLYPGRFAAIAPICGGLPWLANVERSVQVIKKTPVWAFHGALDSTVPVGETRQIVKALEAAGGNVTYTEYPDLNHDSWTVTYDNPELYKWFLKHTI